MLAWSCACLDKGKLSALHHTLAFLETVQGVGPDGGIAEGLGARAMGLALPAGPSEPQALCFGVGVLLDLGVLWLPVLGARW